MSRNPFFLSNKWLYALFLGAVFMMTAASVTLTEFILYSSFEDPVLGIIEVNPPAGEIGQAVTITGFGFSAVPGNNMVGFNGVMATVNTASEGELEVVVPPGATTGLVSVAVAQNTAYSDDDFVVF